MHFSITIKAAFAALLFLLSSHGIAALKAMNDDELSDVTGQALFVADKVTENGYTFYRGGIDGTLDLNMNIKNLELGRTDSGVDIHAENLSFGCTWDGTDCVDSADATGLKPFSLSRPYLQFAIKNDDNPTLREVVGLRLGAENVNGPLSIGKFKSFSGFLTASANITMQGQYDVGVTCDNAHAPCTGTAQETDCRAIFGCYWLPRPPTSDGSTYYEENPTQDAPSDANPDNNFTQPEWTLGVKDDHECVFTLTTECVSFSQLTVGFETQSRSGLPVTLNGKRKTQALIAGLRLSDLVDDIVHGTDTTNPLEVIRPDGLSGFLIDAVLPLLRDSVAQKFKNQLAAGLNVSDLNGDGSINDELNSYQMPYNISNLHRVDINSSDFGLSFQKESVQYPGFQAAMPIGWGMHMPDAFTLNISDKTSVFVGNIATSSAARDGNIIGLPAVYDNCFGSAQFC